MSIASQYDFVEYKEEDFEGAFDLPVNFKRSKTVVELKELFQDEDYKMIQRYTGFITATCILLTTLFSFFLSLNAYQTMVDNTDQIMFLFDNWKRNYIVDIITIKREDKGPEGYESMIDRQWPGTYEGCYGNNDEDSDLSFGSCTYSQINSGGINI